MAVTNSILRMHRQAHGILDNDEMMRQVFFHRATATGLDLKKNVLLKSVVYGYGFKFFVTKFISCNLGILYGTIPIDDDTLPKLNSTGNLP